MDGLGDGVGVDDGGVTVSGVDAFGDLAGGVPGSGRGDRALLVCLARDGGAARDGGRPSRPGGFRMGITVPTGRAFSVDDHVSHGWPR